MQDRIEINGVWYVREDLSNTQEEDFELSFSLHALYENDNYCWEATRLYKDDIPKYFYDDLIDIKFTDKRVKPWKEDHWDNNFWMKGVLDNDPESLKDARESMCPSGVKTFQLFLNKLKEQGWTK
jgi:hypothetical protein